MKLRTKITLVNIMVLLFAIVITLSILLHNIYREKDKELEQIRRFEDERARQSLKNMMEIGFNIVENNYANSNNKNYLVQTYGTTLVNTINCLDVLMSSGFGKNVPELQILSFKEASRRISPENVVYWIADGGSGEVLAWNTDQFPFEPEKITDMLREHPDSSYRFESYVSSRMPRLVCVKKIPERNLYIAAGLTESYVVAQAQEKSREQIRNVIFDNGSGYIYAFNTACVNIVHPYLRHLENTDFSYVKDARGMRLVQEMINLVLKQDEGFINYYWPRPRKNLPDIPDAPKLTYVKLFKPWMWMVATGVYVDSIDEMVKQKSEVINASVGEMINKTIFNTCVLTVVLIIFSVFFSASISRPIEQLAQTMKDINPDSLNVTDLCLKGSTEIVQLGKTFNMMLRKVSDSMIKVKEAAGAREKAINELNVAHEIQSEIIPQLFPIIHESDGFEDYVINFPSEGGGSTLYELQMVAPDKLCFMVGDVSRAGLPASMYTIVIRSLLRTAGLHTSNSGVLLNEISSILSRNRHMSTYISAFLGILDLKTGELNYTNAGHAFPLLVRQLRDIEEIPTIHGSPLGLQKNMSYLNDRIFLTPGDVVLLYSNGLLSMLKRVHGEGKEVTLIRNMLVLNLRSTAEDTMFNTEKYIEDVVAGMELDEDVMVMGVHYRGPGGGNDSRSLK